MTLEFRSNSRSDYLDLSSGSHPFSLSLSSTHSISFLLWNKIAYQSNNSDNLNAALGLTKSWTSSSLATTRREYVHQIFPKPLMIKPKNGFKPAFNWAMWAHLSTYKRDRHHDAFAKLSILSTRVAPLEKYSFAPSPLEWVHQMSVITV